MSEAYRKRPLGSRSIAERSIANVISASGILANSWTDPQDDTEANFEDETDPQSLEGSARLPHAYALASAGYHWNIELDWNVAVLDLGHLPPRVIFDPVFTASDFEIIASPPSVSETGTTSVLTSTPAPNYSIDNCTAVAKVLLSQNTRLHDVGLHEFESDFSVFIDRYGSAGVSVLFSELVALGGGDERSWIAITILAEHPNEPTFDARRELLILLLNAEDDAGLRYCAAEALGNLGGNNLTTALNERLEKERNQSVRIMIHAQLRT